jgi:hypothetical protein
MERKGILRTDTVTDGAMREYSVQVEATEARMGAKRKEGGCELEVVRLCEEDYTTAHM